MGYFLSIICGNFILVFAGHHNFFLLHLDPGLDYIQCRLETAASSCHEKLTTFIHFNCRLSIIVHFPIHDT
jgi:hypothetical protein